MPRETYESPSITDLGTVQELTLGGGGDDSDVLGPSPLQLTTP